jgi:hypothetical protein
MRHPLAAAAAALSIALPLQAQVARFDATTDTIQIAGQTTLATAATFEARVLLQPGGGGSVFFEQADGREHKQLAVDATGISGMGFTLPSNQSSFFAAVPVTAGAFHHIAFVRDGSTERLYLDGQRVGERPATGDIDDAGDTFAAVGARLFQNTSFMAAAFIGDIDTLRISGVARYSGASFTAPAGDLTSDADTQLLYNFNAADLVAGQLADLSGNGRHGTLGVGFASATAPQITSAVPEPASWALLLAGAGVLVLRRRATRP